MASRDPIEVSRIPSPTRPGFDPGLVSNDIALLGAFPERLRRFLEKIPPEDMRQSHRPGGWNVVQIVHHLVDSHLNAYTRTKFALVESVPTIKPYDENAWVSTPECTVDDIHLALHLLHALHARWEHLYASLDEAAWSRSFFHPERNVEIRLYEQVADYAWHGEHHLAQAAIALRRELPL
jgi:hypothetical protein